VLKYLVVAALLSLLLLLLYSRLYPYLQIVKKVFGVAKNITDTPRDASVRAAKTEGRLVRCESCGTWIPADRAIGFKSGRTKYCSRECIEKGASRPNIKAAG
jgi:hypothetical protein